MAFIESYYNDKLAETKYSDYLKGLINSKSEAFKDIGEDTRHLMSAIKDRFIDHCEKQDYLWHRRAEEVEYLKNHMTFEKLKTKYHDLLIDTDQRRMAIFRTFPEL